MSLQTPATEKYEKTVKLLEFMREQEKLNRISVSEAFGLLKDFADNTNDPLTKTDLEGNPYARKAPNKKKCICF